MKSKNIPLLTAAILLFAMACMCSDTGSLVTPTAAVNTPVIEEAPTIEEQQPSSSGYISEVTLARDVAGEEKSPVDPTTVFGTDSVVHAVVKIEDSPAGTLYTAEFYVVDVGAAADPGSLITSTELEADGTRYIDFNLTPTTSWPTGTYRVDILVNGQLDQSVEYTVE